MTIPITLRTLMLPLLTLMLSLGVAVAADKPSPPAEKPAPAHSVQTVDPATAQSLVAGKKVTVLDIRTPAEFQAGHIAGATNISFHSPDFEKRIAALPKDGSYLVHCASGNRSTRSLPVFKKHGHGLVYHFEGGMKAWEKARLPVAK